MFNLPAGKSAYPQLYSSRSSKKGTKKDTSQSSPITATIPGSAMLGPAMDRPPSPERIRAYNEQIKRSSIFGNNSRTNTLSSVTPSFRSRDSVSGSTIDSIALSRKSSARSNASNMHSPRSERPESVQKLSSLFSRSGRKGRKDSNTLGAAAQSTAFGTDTVGEDSVNWRSHGRRRTGSASSLSQRRHLISGPYNFQHVTHTRQDHLPNLDHSSRTELMSGFSAIRAVQASSSGELRGIRAQDLHFENFSSEALSSDENKSPALSPKSPLRQQAFRRTSASPGPHLCTNSQEIRKSPPQRPPRSPLSPTCPVTLPARTSSRTASTRYDANNPLATTSVERPYINAGIRRPAPLNVSSTPPPPPLWNEQDGYFFERPMSHAVTTPGDEAWPLSSAGSPSCGDLADVEEEEEEAAFRQSSVWKTGLGLSTSQSVPMLRAESQDQDELSTTPNARMSTTLQGSHFVTQPRSSLAFGFQGCLFRDSWEDDVDFCYQNEIEADCDYQWVDGEDDEGPLPVAPIQPQPQLDLHLEDDERSVYHGHFRPSHLVPSTLDIPELSPMSCISSSSCDPRTPSNILQPSHNRSPSHASSFKEAHGFNLSPSLLIPTDFKAQIDEEILYDEHMDTNSTSTAIYPEELFHHAISPADDSISTTNSHRSSGFSRESARSSSSTRISMANSRGSQDSVMILSRAANKNQSHRSYGSASSLPDLIPSTVRKSESIDDLQVAGSISTMNIDGSVEPAPAPDVVGPAPAFASVQHRRNKALIGDPIHRKVPNHFASPLNLSLPPIDATASKTLSPVAESSVESMKDTVVQAQSQFHERNISAPLIGANKKEFTGRVRAQTTSETAPGKTKGGYMLFPQM